MALDLSYQRPDQGAGLLCPPSLWSAIPAYLVEARNESRKLPVALRLHRARVAGIDGCLVGSTAEQRAGDGIGSAIAFWRIQTLLACFRHLDREG